MKCHASDLYSDDHLWLRFPYMQHVDYFSIPSSINKDNKKPATALVNSGDQIEGRSLSVRGSGLMISGYLLIQSRCGSLTDSSKQVTNHYSTMLFHIPMNTALRKVLLIDLICAGKSCALFWWPGFLADPPRPDPVKGTYGDWAWDNSSMTATVLVRGRKGNPESEMVAATRTLKSCDA